jgi:hypothetical protein
MKIGFQRVLSPVVRFFERALSLVVLAGCLVSLIQGVRKMAGADWSATDTFYDLIYRILLLVIGLELVRMLYTHSLAAVLELLAFVIARKMLKPDLTAMDIILSVLAFVILLAGRKYLMSRSCYLSGELSDDSDASAP